MSEKRYCIVCGAWIRSPFRNTNTCSPACTRKRDGKPERPLTFNHCEICGIAIDPWRQRCPQCMNE